MQSPLLFVRETVFKLRYRVYKLINRNSGQKGVSIMDEKCLSKQRVKLNYILMVSGVT